MLLVLALAGCDWRLGGSNLPPPARPVRVSEEQAKKSVIELPETVAYAQQSASQTNGGKVRTKVFMFPESTATVNEDPFWVIDILNERDESSKLWQRFKINAVNGEITVWNSLSDEYENLDQWQRNNATKLPATTSSPTTTAATTTTTSPATTTTTQNQPHLIIYKPDAQTTIGDNSVSVWPDANTDRHPSSERQTQTSPATSKPTTQNKWRLPS